MSRRVTMGQVAAAAGVSPMTVSYVFSRPDRVAPATRSRVRAAAAELGYAGPNPAARSLRQGRLGSVAVVLSEPLTYAFQDPQANRFLAGVASVCVERSLGINLVPLEDDRAEQVALVAADAFLLWTRADGDPVLAAVQQSGVPAGILGGPRVPGVRLVTIDDRAAARAVAAAAFAGARSPAVLSLPLGADRVPVLLRGAPPARAAFAVTRHRLEGARDACRAAGRPWGSVRVAVLSRNSAAEAQHAVRALLLAPDPPDALLAMSDELALGALAAARDCGVAVPAALAVTGWDGSAAATAAGLTTVEQSLYDQGRLLVRGVLDPSVEIPEPGWRLVRRSTTRPAG